MNGADLCSTVVSVIILVEFTLRVVVFLFEIYSLIAPFWKSCCASWYRATCRPGWRLVERRHTRITKSRFEKSAPREEVEKALDFLQYLVSPISAYIRMCSAWKVWDFTY